VQPDVPPLKIDAIPGVPKQEDNVKHITNVTTEHNAELTEEDLWFMLILLVTDTETKLSSNSTTDTTEEAMEEVSTSMLLDQEKSISIVDMTPMLMRVMLI